MNLYSQNLDDTLFNESCNCFTNNLTGQVNLELCLGTSSSIFQDNEIEIFAQIIEDYNIDTTLTSITDLQFLDEFIDEWVIGKLKNLTERLIFECTSFYEYIDSVVDNTDYIKELVPMDSAMAIKRIPVFTELIDNDLGYTQTFTQRGSLFLLLGETEKAISDFNKALELDSTNTSAISFLGFTHLMEKNYSEAEIYFDALYDLTGEMGLLMFRSLMIRRQLDTK